MPTIQSVLKLQFGRQVSPLVKTTSLQVDSLEEITLSVDGVPKSRTVKPVKGGKVAVKKKDSKQFRKATYKPTFSNVKFLAIYNNGKGDGLRIKVGKMKTEILTEPLVFIGKDAEVFNDKTAIILENDSPIPKSVVMLIGSDLSKDARNMELVGPSKKESPAKVKKIMKR
jgi:hypothetical protein